MGCERFKSIKEPMSATQECVPCCSATPLVINTPGPAGATGPYPITTNSVSFTVPIIGNTVTVTVASTVPFVIGQNIFVAISNGGANFLVSAINSPTSMTLKAVGFTGDSASGTTVPINSTIVMGTGNLSAPALEVVTTAPFTVPAVSNSVTVSVSNTSQLVAGMNLFIGGANFLLQSITSSTQILLESLQFAGDAASGTSVPATSSVLAVGNLKATPVNTVVTGNFIIPAVGSTVVVNVVDARQLQPGVNVVVYNATQQANFVVVSAIAAAVTLRYLGYVGDTAAAQGINAGAILTVGSANVSLQYLVVNDSNGTFNNNTNNSQTSIAVNLRNNAGVVAVPRLVKACMACVTSDANSGWNAGDELELDCIRGNTEQAGVITWAVTAAGNLIINNNLAAFVTPLKIYTTSGTVINFSTGSGGAANQANFQLRFYLQI